MTTDRKGPLESRTWPTALEASAVDDRGGHHGLHGYSVESDLAVHYRFSDGVYLALTGELPDAAASRAFEIALLFLLPLSVARAPAHAGVLAGFVGSPPSGLLATAAVTLAEDAIRTNRMIAAVDDGATELPPELCGSSIEDTAAVDLLRARLDGLLDVPLLAKKPSREVALIALLHACGLTTPLQVASAVAVARISSVVAEAGPRATQSFVEKYPLDTPPFHYVVE